MQCYVDHRLLKLIEKKSHSDNWPFKLLIDHAINREDLSLDILLGWPSLLELLDLGNLFEDFPYLTHQSELYSFIIARLAYASEQENLIRAYDQIFVECLTYVKALPMIHPDVLLEKIEKKQRLLQSHGDTSFFSASLGRYEKLLAEDPKNFMHDLILYLAWDRVCINLAMIFEHVSVDVNVQPGLNVFKHCLIESFEHITGQRRTRPSFFRLMEALYAFQMRNENMDSPTDAEWSILCEGAVALTPREKLSDAWFIDGAIKSQSQLNEIGNHKELLKVLTIDSPENIHASMSLASYMIHILNTSNTGKVFYFQPTEVMCLKEKEGQLYDVCTLRFFDSFLNESLETNSESFD